MVTKTLDKTASLKLKKCEFPVVSIIVPVYNTEQYLSKCLDSIINQTYKNLEIICVNDGSTDNSAEILNEYAKKSSRIKVLTQENQGVSKARNTGLGYATGSYILFVDSDDWLELNAIEEILNNADDFDVTVFSHYSVSAKGTRTNKFKHFKSTYKFNDINSYINNVLYLPSLVNKFYKKEFIKGLQFPENVVFQEDRLFWYDVLYKKPSIKILNKPLYNYLNTRLGNSTNNFEKVYKNFLYYHELMQQTDLYKNAGEIEKIVMLERDLHFFCWMMPKHKNKYKEIIELAQPFMREIENSPKIKKMKYYKQLRKKIFRFKVKSFIQKIFKHA